MVSEPVLLSIGGTFVATAAGTAFVMHQHYRNRRDDKAERRIEACEAKVEKMRETVHAHDLKVQSLEHLIQSMGESKADHTYRESKNGPQS